MTKHKPASREICRKGNGVLRQDSLDLRMIRQQLSTIILLLIIVLILGEACAQPYRSPQHCSNRLENALEQARRRSSGRLVNTATAASSRLLAPESPYKLYHALYGQHNDDDKAGADNFYSSTTNSGGNNSGRGYQSQHKQPLSFGAIDNLMWGDSWEQQLSQLRLRYRQTHKLGVSRIDVEDLRVRLPSKKTTNRWVEVDKCRFTNENATLDTRLIFPDLTISGRVVMQPTGGKCNMVLRLRHAGIEFHTIPLSYGTDRITEHNEDTRRGSGNVAAVRTDSHFAEPGFISVFAHGCQGPTGIRLRHNSKRRIGITTAEDERPDVTSPPSPEVELSAPQVVLGTAHDAWSTYQDIFTHRRHPEQSSFYDVRSELSQERWPPSSYYGAKKKDDLVKHSSHNHRRFKHYISNQQRSSYDEMDFNDDILNFDEGVLKDLLEPDARTFADLYSNGPSSIPQFTSSSASNVLSVNRDEMDDAFSNELERLFSMGVRSLLTTYMQRALQPAIKETLMENMGYTLSYG